MAYSAPNPTPYEAALYPIETAIIAVKRGDGTTAGGGTGTAVDSYLAENINIVRPSTVIDRKGIYGEGKGEPRIIRQPMTWSSTVQINLLTTNTIRPGDYFEEAVDVDSATVSTTKVRFIVSSCTHARIAGQPHTYNLEAVEDYVNSPKYGA